MQAAEISGATAARPAEWTFADVWETVAGEVPDHVALVHGERRITWRDFDRRADGIAAALLDAGLQHQDKVALYLHNAPAYLEGVFAALKARLVPVNTNYRYTGDELVQLWTDADAAAVIFHGRFLAQADAVRARCPSVKAWLFVDDGEGACPGWATPFDSAAQGAAARTGAPQGRSGDDQVLIYTGGTTGLPRGVMWRQHDMFLASNTTGDPEVADYDHIRKRLHGAAPPIGLPAAPLMHGTAFVFAATILNRGGTVVTLPGGAFDVPALFDAMVREGVTDLCIVGDAFCRPMVDALDREPHRWDLQRLRVVSSSGMAWSASVKERLLAHAPSALLIDFLNASEASGMGRALTSAKRKDSGSRFQLGKNACVIGEDGRPLMPGDPEPGRLAVSGHIPLGYYKDPVKTAATFPVIDGVRYSVPGDLATVDADGAITLLGRGSTSINTGGEKVYPEEVEDAITAWPGVADTLVVGIPHERFGQMVVAAVAMSDGAPLDERALLEHLRSRLAGHKIPRAIMPVASIERGPNGKADRPGVTARIVAWLDSGKRETMS
ncbi:MAG: AMP-binding protein [Sphingomonadales bacterium]|nr:AMP-binding protein [Sphingomonadales bacterium]